MKKLMVIVIALLMLGTSSVLCQNSKMNFKVYGNVLMQNTFFLNLTPWYKLYIMWHPITGV